MRSTTHARRAAVDTGGFVYFFVLQADGYCFVFILFSLMNIDQIFSLQRGRYNI
jgi:hypothetical protein